MSSIWTKGLKFSIFGESHGLAIGVVIDNLPAGLEINFEKIKQFMQRRAPSILKCGSSNRCENDNFKILSGIFNNKTCGSPLCAVILNESANSGIYKKFENILRPGHADYSAKIRYGGFNNFLGSGHLSGRLTASLVFIGAICEQLLNLKKIKSFAHILSINEIYDNSLLNENFDKLNLDIVKKSSITVLNKKIILKIKNKIKQCKKNGDSLGGIVECGVFGVPAGIGSPIFDGIENYVADLIFAIPAVKGIEFGNGFNSTKMTGWENNDEFILENETIKTKTNHHGGILGGISSGMPIIFRVAFKPTPTISRKQNTIDLNKMTKLQYCFQGQHDNCIVLRAVPVVEAVANIAIVSQFLNQGKFKLENCN